MKCTAIAGSTFDSYDRRFLNHLVAVLLSSYLIIIIGSCGFINRRKIITAFGDHLRSGQRPPQIWLATTPWGASAPDLQNP